MPPDRRLSVSPRAIRYFIAIMVVVTGVLCGAAIPGTVGGTICTALVGIGLVSVVSLIFYDVGLTEDRERARSLPLPLPDESRRGRERPSPSAVNGGNGHRADRSAPRTRLGRMRGQRRRLP